MSFSSVWSRLTPTICSRYAQDKVYDDLSGGQSGSILNHGVNAKRLVRCSPLALFAVYCPLLYKPSQLQQISVCSPSVLFIPSTMTSTFIRSAVVLILLGTVSAVDFHWRFCEPAHYPMSASPLTTASRRQRRLRPRFAPGRHVPRERPQRVSPDPPVTPLRAKCLLRQRRRGDRDVLQRAYREGLEPPGDRQPVPRQLYVLNSDLSYDAAR